FQRKVAGLSFHRYGRQAASGVSSAASAGGYICAFRLSVVSAASLRCDKLHCVSVRVRYLWRCDRRSSKRVSGEPPSGPSSATIFVVCGAPSRLLRVSSSPGAPDSDLDRLVASFFKLA
ncbi:unnamed protein product, partial [Ixodes persulcatus]